MAISLAPGKLYADSSSDNIDMPALKLYRQDLSVSSHNSISQYTQDIPISDTGVYQIVANANPNKCGSGLYAINVVATIRCWNAWNTGYAAFLQVQQEVGDAGSFDWVIYYSPTGGEYTSNIPQSALTGSGLWSSSDVYLRCKISNITFNCGANTPDPRSFYIHRIADCP